MFWMITVLLSLSSTALAGPIEHCEEIASEWLAGLEEQGCTPGSDIQKGAVAGCLAIPEDGWTRAQKTARRALFQRCTPSPDGFGAPQGEEEDGNPPTTCGEYILSIRGEESNSPPPETPTMGVDQMVAAMGVAVFSCAYPQAIEACRKPADSKTLPSHLHKRREACLSLTTPPLDSVIHSLVWNSGLMPVNPEIEVQKTDALILEQRQARLLRLKEKTIFKQLRIDEVQRAKELRDTCLSNPEELAKIEEVEAADTACNELKALWRGEDTTRVQLEEDGSIALRFIEQLQGKPLHPESLNVVELDKIDSHRFLLLEQMRLAVAARFIELIESDLAAAEALISAHRAQMDPAWVKDAIDQVLAEGG